MQVNYNQAEKLFKEIAEERKCPSLHPRYLQIDSKREKGMEPTFFVFEEYGEIYYYPFLAADVPDTKFRDIQSPYGYGGPISTTDNRQFIDRAWSAFTSWCQENNILAEFVRFHPILQNWRYHNGETVLDRETVWVDLTNEDLSIGYQSRVRNMLRKATKHGLKVEWCEAEVFFQWFPELYESLMKSLQANSFYFFSNEYYGAWYGWDQAHYALCVLEGEVVAASIFFSDKNIMEYHLSASNDVGRQLAASTMILHEAAELGKNLQCRKLHLGGGTNSLENNPLLFFKSGFSKERASFRIGKMIHKPDCYEELKTFWKSKNGSISDRILFYR